MSDLENDTGTLDTKTVPQIDSTRIRLPEFWTDTPEVWFAQAEAQFSLANVSADSTKFFHVISALPREVCSSVFTLVKQPPAKNKYDTLKAALTHRHTPSAGRRLEILVDGIEVGDRKPSEVYWSMRNLAGDQYDENLVRTFWLRRLPKSLYIALTAIGDKPIDDILEIADRINEATGSNVSSLQNLASSSSQKPSDSTLEKIEARLASMESRFSKFSRERNRSPRSPSKSRQCYGRPRSSSRRRFIDSEGVCYYHHKFGNAARKCYLPCKLNRRYVTTRSSSEEKNK